MDEYQWRVTPLSPVTDPMREQVLDAVGGLPHEGCEVSCSHDAFWGTCAFDEETVERCSALGLAVQQLTGGKRTEGDTLGLFGPRLVPPRDRVRLLRADEAAVVSPVLRLLGVQAPVEVEPLERLGPDLVVDGGLRVCLKPAAEAALIAMAAELSARHGCSLVATLPDRPEFWIRDGLVTRPRGAHWPELHAELWALASGKTDALVPPERAACVPHGDDGQPHPWVRGRELCDGEGCITMSRVGHYAAFHEDVQLASVHGLVLPVPADVLHAVQVWELQEVVGPAVPCPRKGATARGKGFTRGALTVESWQVRQPKDALSRCLDVEVAWAVEAPGTLRELRVEVVNSDGMSTEASAVVASPSSPTACRVALSGFSTHWNVRWVATVAVDRRGELDVP